MQVRGQSGWAVQPCFCDVVLCKHVEGMVMADRTDICGLAKRGAQPCFAMWLSENVAGRTLNAEMLSAGREGIIAMFHAACLRELL